jgi:hypothetical protein
LSAAAAAVVTPRKRKRTPIAAAAAAAAATGNSNKQPTTCTPVTSSTKNPPTKATTSSRDAICDLTVDHDTLRNDVARAPDETPKEKAHLNYYDLTVSAAPKALKPKAARHIFPNVLDLTGDD